MTITKDQFINQHNDDKKDGFTRWMQEPTTKALISTIAPSEHLEALLQSAFETGFGSGISLYNNLTLMHTARPRP